MMLGILTQVKVAAIWETALGTYCWLAGKPLLYEVELPRQRTILQAVSLAGIDSVKCTDGLPVLCNNKVGPAAANSSPCQRAASLISLLRTISCARAASTLKAKNLQRSAGLAWAECWGIIP